MSGKVKNDLTIDNFEFKKELDMIKTMLLKKSDRSSRLQDYMEQPNVKNFNMLLLDRGFSRFGERDTKGTLPIFTDVEYAKNEIIEYFKTCNEYNMTPHIGSLCSFTGMRRDELIYYSAHPEICPSSQILAKAMDYCQYILEESVINDRLDPRIYAFMGSNYFKLHNSTTVVEIKPSLSGSALENQGIESNQSLVALREQIANKSKKIVDSIEQ